MGALITRVKLREQISLTNWDVTEDGVDINGTYNYISFPSPITSFPLEGTESGVTYNLYASENGSEYSLIYSGGTPVVQGYKHSSLESYMFYDGSQWALWFDGTYQWVNPNGEQNILPLNNWQIYVAQGPAGNIQITDSSIKNISFLVKKTNSVGGKIISNENYILNSKFNADNQYPIADGSQFFDNNFYLEGNCGYQDTCTILTNYRHNSPLLYSPYEFDYYTFANRTFHEINAPYNTLPIGHPIQPRLIKMFGVGSKFGRTQNISTIINTASFVVSPPDNTSWTKYGVEQIVKIPSWATKVVYGVKYLAKSDDLFRDNNFAGLKLNFRLLDEPFNTGYRNYVNVHLIRRSTASAVDTLESLYGSNIYTYFNTSLSTAASNQWLGPNIGRVKVRKRSSTIIDSNTNQFIKIKDTIDIPTFSSSSAEPDFGNGRPDTVSLEMFFAEWVSYFVNSGPNGTASGSIYFYEPFIYFV
jgi:hypothetical protein